MWKNAVAHAELSSHLGWPRLSLERDWLREQSGGSASTHAWARVVDVVSDKAHLFVLTGLVEGFVVPRSAFASPGEADAFAGELVHRARAAAGR